MNAGRFGMTALLAALTACAPAADTGASGADKRPVEGGAPGEPLDAGALQERLIAYAASLRETADASEDAFSKALKITLTPPCQRPYTGDLCLRSAILGGYPPERDAGCSSATAEGVGARQECRLRSLAGAGVSTVGRYFRLIWRDCYPSQFCCAIRRGTGI